jgi:hypothetical protein
MDPEGLPTGSKGTDDNAHDRCRSERDPTPSAANSVAVTIRDLARRESHSGQIHLFLIGPLGLAVLLGHHCNRLTTTHVYEHIGGLDYLHAFTVEA